MQLDTLQPLLYRLQTLVTMEVRQYALIIAQTAEPVKSGYCSPPDNQGGHNATQD